MHIRMKLAAVPPLAFAALAAVSTACGDEGDDGTPMSRYCEAKCAYENACEEAVEDPGACEAECAATTQDQLASWEGECVEEWLAGKECVAGEAAQNGCDDDAAEATCADELEATSACYCSPICTPNLVGNGACDGACNNPECEYDGGDCA